jgi:glucan phosphoethanolaminetransferase (alkaline phosphatase superfamily)
VRLRRWAARALLLLPTAAIVAWDFARRPDRLTHFEGFERTFYFITVLLSAFFWGSILALAAQSRGRERWAWRAWLVVAALLAIGGQTYTFERYAAYLNHRAMLVGTSFMPSVGQQLWADRWSFARALLPPLLGALVLPLVLRALAPLANRRRWMAFDFASISLLLGLFLSHDRGAEQGATPDMLYVSAMGQLARARWDHNETVERLHPGARRPIPVPPLTAHPKVPRSVLLIVNESVRAMSTCISPDEPCTWTPFTHKITPNRIGFHQMRALESTTAVSIAVMWGGMLPTSSRETFHTEPLIWEYAKAAGLGTAYFTSQNMLFGNSGLWLDGIPTDKRLTGTQIDPTATMELGCDDGDLMQRSLAEIAQLKMPYVAVVHLSNTHFPYKIDPELSPFLPQEEATGPGYENEIHNRYQDAIYLQDKALARFLEGLRELPQGQDAVVLYISDHGEQMREKGAVGHTGTLYDVEIRVPLWIDAPKGTLTEEEEATLRSLKDTPLTQLDVLPTMLDLLGLWDEPEIAPFRARMMGQSLLRGGSTPDRPLVLSNCTEIFACAFKNWGAMRGTKKLIADQSSRSWMCFDFAADPEELHDLGPEACGELRELAEKTMGGRPF